MNMKQRTHSVEQFHNDKNIKIMIAVLKCGGVGLNLNCANRCITIDPWWNRKLSPVSNSVFEVANTPHRFRGTTSLWPYLPDWATEGDSRCPICCEEHSRHANPGHAEGKDERN